MFTPVHRTQSTRKQSVQLSFILVVSLSKPCPSWIGNDELANCRILFVQSRSHKENETNHGQLKGESISRSVTNRRLTEQKHKLTNHNLLIKQLQHNQSIINIYRKEQRKPASVWLTTTKHWWSTKRDRKQKIPTGYWCTTDLDSILDRWISCGILQQLSSIWNELYSKLMNRVSSKTGFDLLETLERNLTEVLFNWSFDELWWALLGITFPVAAAQCKALYSGGSSP